MPHMSGRFEEVRHAFAQRAYGHQARPGDAVEVRPRDGPRPALLHRADEGLELGAVALVLAAARVRALAAAPDGDLVEAIHHRGAPTAEDLDALGLEGLVPTRLVGDLRDAPVRVAKRDERAVVTRLGARPHGDGLRVHA